MGYEKHISNQKSGISDVSFFIEKWSVTRLEFLIFLPLLFVLASACGDSFEPLESNNEYFFSMYGYLDAAADTQWVHITPVREQVDNLGDGSGIRVTIENMETGRQIVMNDSLFQQVRDFLNFWTDEPLEYNQTYRLKAEHQNGERSGVTVITPEEMPLPKISLQLSNDPLAPPEYYVLVDKSVNLADIQVIYYIRLLGPAFSLQRTYSFAYRNAAVLSEDFPDYYSVQIDPEKEMNEIERQVLLPPDGEIEVVYRQVSVATSGIELNEEIQALDDVIYALPETLRNVEMGLGYVIGIDRKYIPYEGCIGEEGRFVSCGAEEPFW